MKSPNSFRNARTSTTPIGVPRSMRRHDARLLTSLPAGKMVPIFAGPVLREDAVRGQIRLSFEMMETVEILMNAVNVAVSAYFVPYSAFERFNRSIDIMNRSYMGQPPLDGEAVIPFIETELFGTHGSNEVYKYLGLHGRADQTVNTAYLEAYNAIWNFRAKNRSPDIDQRLRLDKTLAPAFWRHEMFSHIVPDFDQAAIDGEVPLAFGAQKLPVRGLGILANASEALTTWHSAGHTVNKVGGVTEVTVATAGERWSKTKDVDTGNDVGDNIELVSSLTAKEDVENVGFPDVWAELIANDVRISLSNIDMARKTAAFAKLRQRYNGHSDEWLIDMLMSGLSVPEQALCQPILVSERTTIFGMSKRYASDAANLTESVVNGATFVDLPIRLPRISTGGVLMVVAEITPEQLFERQRDPLLHLVPAVDETADDVFPSFLRDDLDPEPVEVVPNEHVDVDHDTPSGQFGFAPLNYRWNVTAPRIGGRFYRPTVDAGFDEDRQRLWAVETQNPVLSADFYLCTTMHTKPFVVTNQDPFEVVGQGGLLIEGITKFGPPLIEATDDYNLVLDKVDTGKIVKGEGA